MNSDFAIYRADPKRKDARLKSCPTRCWARAIQILWGSLLLFNLCYSPRYGNIREYQKGIALPSWEREEYLDERVLESLFRLKETGAEYIAVIPAWYQKSKESNSIYPTERTPSNEAIKSIIITAHRMGYGVMLKPHLDVEDGSFRGDVSPENIEKWFHSYKTFILHYAGIAEELKVEEFCIGTELRNLSSRKEWIEIIDSIRDIYTGPLLYAANWDEYPKVSLWSYLDLVGIDAYFPLAQHREATIEEYLENFELWLSQLDCFQEKAGKEIIITEVGFRSIKGSGVRPYDWKYKGIMDEGSQSYAYRTILETLQRKAWLSGIFFWKWDPILIRDSLGYSPYGKKAEDVLKEFWR